MAIKSFTEYTYEHKTGDVFPLPFNPESDPEHVYISPDGLKAVLAFLVRDEDAADPFEEFDEGDFYQFDRSYKHDTPRPDLEEFKRIARANPGRVFTVDRYGDGYSVGSPVTVADCRGARKSQGEKCRAAELLDNADGYYIVPEDATDPASYAEAQLEQYSQWCEGDCYGVCVWTYQRDSIDDEWTEDPERDECWGYYGSEGYTAEELQDRFNAAVTHTNGRIHNESYIYSQPCG